MAIALIFYFAVFTSQARFVTELFLNFWETDFLYIVSLAFLSYVYIFLFFAFLVNWCNIADRFMGKVRGKWIRRIIPSVVLFATASFTVGWGLEAEGSAFLTWNPVVVLFRCIWVYTFEFLVNIFA